MSKKYTLKNLYADLYISGNDYKQERTEWHKDLLRVVEIINNNRDKKLKAVLSSDVEFEKDFLCDCDLEMIVDYNINGIIIYHTQNIKKEQKKI